MAAYLAGPIVLGLSAVISISQISLTSYRRNQTNAKKIELPIASDEGLDGKPHDPFDLHDDALLVDGTPINGDGFWTKVKWAKLALLAVSLMLLLTHLASFILSLTSAATSLTRDSLIASIITTIVDIYILALSYSYVSLETVPRHWPMTIHIASLTGVAAAWLAIKACMPPSMKAHDGEQTVPTVVLTWAEFGLSVLANTIVVLIPRGPKLHFPISKIYTPKVVASAEESSSAVLHESTYNVSGETDGNIVSQLMFGFATKVVWLGYTAESLEAYDLPIVPYHMRSMYLFTQMRKIYGRTQKKTGAKAETGWFVLLKVFRANQGPFVTQAILAIITSGMYYLPALFINRLVAFLESDPNREHPYWGWVYCFSLFFFSLLNYILTGMLWSVSTTLLQSRIKIQLNTMLFAKTLMRKDVAGGAPAAKGAASDDKEKNEDAKEDDEDVTSKSQVMTLMTVDVDRVAEFSFHTFSLIDAPLEIVIGSAFLYRLLGNSALFGLAATICFLPMNHLASKVVVKAQDELMKARDERTALMNEVLQGIRMLKFMAWERSFEKRIMEIRKRELGWQKTNYMIEVAFTFIWSFTPVGVTLATFLHYVWWRGEPLTPSIAFTAVAVLGELRFALNALPETFISVLQGFVSLRRIEKYLGTAEIEQVLPSLNQSIIFNNATVTWPRAKVGSGGTPGLTSAGPSSAATTPRLGFVLRDLTLNFPENDLTLICGKLGSGKTLMLLALLGEADVVSGQLICPRSSSDAMSKFSSIINPTEWVQKGLTAYVPQTAWLQNASIKSNILFNLPFDEERYKATIAACSLLTDLEILEDGDETEIGEKGLNLSGGQKARVSLARAVYSRASILLLDDVLSAVDAHTAHHLFNNCLKGPLMKDRTVVLVSHHVQLTAPGAAYIVALDNGDVQYAGSRDGFMSSGLLAELVTEDPEGQDAEKKPAPEIEEIKEEESAEPDSKASSVTLADGADAATPAPKDEKKAARKFVEDEARAVGRIDGKVWALWLGSQGGWLYWFSFFAVTAIATFTPVLENGWLRIWSSSYIGDEMQKSAMYYIGIYSLVTILGVLFAALKFFVLYLGSLKASANIHKVLLERVLFGSIRFHDKVSTGRLLNRFGKDMEGLDSAVADNFGRSVFYGSSLIVTFSSIGAVGGLPFIVAAALLGFMYFQIGKIYGQSSRDMRRLDSVTRSPLYSLYGETVAGVSVIRAFGASANALRLMMASVDTNLTSFYWLWTLNRWLSARFNLLSSAVVGITGVAVLISGKMSPATAGFALAFANTVSGDALFIVRRFVSLEQSMVAMERIKEYSEIALEAPEFVEPRPAASWPAEGEVEVKDLVIRYAPELPNVLHKISFKVEPCMKVGIVGPTGCGKSTLALSFFRFVEATEGSITIDNIDISKIGLTDLRSRVTIIPQDPTILSGTLRSTLDVFDEYEDADIYEALRRVHLLPSVEECAAIDAAEAAAKANGEEDAINPNVFRNLESPVSENGENFSQGEKQLLCMARAILRRNKVLIMDEATANIDYETDALISKTISEEFSQSTILTIAHRLRTIIEFDRVMLLDRGSLIEYDTPAVLLRNPDSKFYALCKAAGRAEFAILLQKAFAKEATDKESKQ